MTEYQVKTENTLAHGFPNEEEMKEERKLDDKDWFCWPQQFTYVSNDSVDYIKDIFYVALASFEGNRATKQTTPKNDKKCKGNVTKCWDERAFNRCTVCQSQQIFIFSSKTIIPFFFRPKYLLYPAPQYPSPQTLIANISMHERKHRYRFPSNIHHAVSLLSLPGHQQIIKYGCSTSPALLLLYFCRSLHEMLRYVFYRLLCIHLIVFLYIFRILCIKFVTFRFVSLRYVTFRYVIYSNEV